ncbi:MAG: uL14 family ribosomal protein [Candidatus Nanohaloarchaea archaeon]|nr:uL14 family ribosomal protein [Candidatus Nanohaloarchaea archaeon]
MKAVASSITKNLEPGSHLVCADNSGADELKIIGVQARAGTRQRRTKAGVSDTVVVRVTKGDQDVKGEVYNAVVIRQRKEYRRPDGLRISFDDNAAVLLEESDIPKGNRIKGVVAKEVVERHSAIGKIASMVV